MNNPHFVTRVELDTVLKELEKPSHDEDVKRIISLYGIGGAGKTTLLKMVDEEIGRRKLEVVSFSIKEDAKYGSVPEFVDAFAKTFSSSVPNTADRFNKLHNEVQRYQKIVGKIQSSFTQEEKRGLEDIKEKAAKAAKRKGKRKFSTPEFEIGPSIKFKTGSYEGEELNGEAESRVWLEHHKEEERRIISERYKDAESQEYFSNPAPNITNCFLSCLQDSLYRPRSLRFLRSKHNFKHNLKKKPLKILFIFDTYEKIESYVSDWLLQFLLPQLQKSEMRDLFDARFIVSGREKLTFSDDLARWGRYEGILLQIDIDSFTRDQVKQFLELRELSVSLVEEAYTETDGLAYLLSIWADTRGEGSALIYGQAANRIFWWKTDEQKDCIKAASFSDYYDQDWLAIFLGDEKAREAYKWLSECHEVTRANKTQEGKCQLHRTVRKVVSRSIKQQSEEIFQDYINRAKTYEDVMSHFPNVSDRTTMLKLCLFRHFNQLVLDEIYRTEAFILQDYAKMHPEWFHQLKQTFKMKDEVRQLLCRYSSWRNQDSMSDTMEKIKGVWHDKRKQLDIEVGKLKEQAEDATKQIKQATFEIQSISQNLQRHRERGEIEESISKARPKVIQKQFSISKPALIFGSIGILSGFAAILQPGAVRATLIPISAVFLIGGLFWIIRSRFRPPSMIDHSTDNRTEESSEKSIEERMRMEKQRSTLESQKEELVQKLNKLDKELGDYEEILAEPYI